MQSTNMIDITFSTVVLSIISLLSLPRDSLQDDHKKLELAFTHRYRYWDDELSQFHICEQCPPGTYRKSHCNASKRTECMPCPDSHYTAYWNSLGECQYCNVFCKEYQYVKHECNSTHNRVCECVQGRYFEFEFCLNHSECPAGFGVKKLGTPFINTECRQCPEGFFSIDNSAIHPCLKHTNCSLVGLKQVLQGDAFQDNVCRPCGKRDASSFECLDPPMEKGIALCDEAIFKFIARQKLTSKELKMLLESLPGKGATTPHSQRLQRTKAGQIRTFLQLKQWRIENPHVDTVKGLMRGLKKANIRNIYKKLSRKLRVNKGSRTALV
ncbi:tumor necrosis factor receptor superfamily member 11B-like [Leucoraja erinacea]|uniref:tumor necrosis factor receptor superfamily member 11B-like n=1 Tax=Leucoraja erinaceus TaxID=7782 RepID=UPI002457F7BC|nr:tumor necrosis factor receptor superfamily member 11B-like [Leucoraja erinacea]